MGNLPTFTFTILPFRPESFIAMFENCKEKRLKHKKGKFGYGFTLTRKFASYIMGRECQIMTTGTES